MAEQEPTAEQLAQIAAENEEDEHSVNYKPPAQKSIQEIQELDKDDESLRKYKEALLGAVTVSAGEPCMALSLLAWPCSHGELFSQLRARAGAQPGHKAEPVLPRARGWPAVRGSGAGGQGGTLPLQGLWAGPGAMGAFTELEPLFAGFCALSRSSQEGKGAVLASVGDERLTAFSLVSRSQRSKCGGDQTDLGLCYCSRPPGAGPDR